MILLYLFLCLALLVVGFLMTSQILPLIGNVGVAKEQLWYMGWWASVGAIINALHTLWQDTAYYKRTHAVWYLTALPAGFIMGVLSGVVFAAILPYVFIKNTPTLRDTSTYVLYLSAGLAGFHWRAILHWLGRVVRSTFLPKDK